jgi:metallo-beta-lactamase family protein
MVEIEFFGAAGEITGSCHIIRSSNHTILLDCGMIQGRRSDVARNAEPFPFDVKEIDAVILSHAHIDHSGRLPLLVKRGYQGPIHTHNASAHLCNVLLQDAAHLQSSISRREQTEPMYSIKDSKQTISQLVGHRYREIFNPTPNIEVCFYDAGHIMGSASISVTFLGSKPHKRLLFSGDLGQYDTPVINDPSAPDQADIVLMESTYGGRTHRNRDQTVLEFGEIISSADQAGGNIVMPAFAVGRSQEILYHLGSNYQQWGLENWRIFLDSPMAIHASEIYWDYEHLYDDDTTRLVPKFNEMPKLPNLHLTRTAGESRVINKLTSRAIIIAGSGMCNGGRILHHLKQRLPAQNNQIVFTGYQARASLGRKIIEGDRSIKIHGEDINVSAKVHTLGGWSAHGDQQDLLRWYKTIKNKPPVYLVHGEPASGKKLQSYFYQTTKDVYLTKPGQKINL